MRQAILELLPQHQRGSRPSPRREAALFERARELLETLAAEPADGDDSPDIEDLLTKAFRQLIRTYDSKLAGDDVWYDERDFIESLKIWAQHSNAWIAQYTGVRPDIVRKAGARAHVVRIKQIISRDGAASTAAIAHDLKAHCLPAYPAFVAALVRMLADMKLITCTDGRYWPGRCQRWALAGRSGKLPFVLRWLSDQQHRAIEDMVDEVVSPRLPHQEYYVVSIPVLSSYPTPVMYQQGTLDRQSKPLWQNSEPATTFY
ncbi:MAG TPA: hypothetical protein VGN72_19900 [Tepidisphaeraceae bacterium]|jgi:hypothetical protein|nr:hypothetical protein [Tepidisphaeraceae bacterium]